jgi:hypothetical protein
MTAWVQKLRELKVKRTERNAEPLTEQVEAAVKSKDSISSVALLDLLDMPKTVGNARRVAKIMRSLNFVPVRNRQLVPGGFRDTVCRGWARPVRRSQSGSQFQENGGGRPTCVI